MDCKSSVKVCSDTEDGYLPYEKKYGALLKKCQSIQQGNDRLVNRIHRVKRLLKQLRKEKRCLMLRLDHYGDEYRKIPLLNPEIQDSNCSLDGVGSKRSHLSQSPSKSHQTSQSNKSHQSSSSKKRSSSSKHLTGHAPSSLPLPIPPKPAVIERDEKPCLSTINSTACTALPNSSSQPIKKPPTNPFFLFCQEQKSSVIDSKLLENKGEMSHQELTRILAMNWNNLPIQEKKVYYKMFEKEKERCDQESKISNSNSCTFNPDIVIKQEIVDN